MKKSFFTFFGLVLGVALGLPLSYYAQPDIVQMKVTLPKYLAKLPRIFEGADPDYVVPIALTCLICALVLGAVGFFIGHATTRSESTSSEDTIPQG